MCTKRSDKIKYENRSNFSIYKKKVFELIFEIDKTGFYASLSGLFMSLFFLELKFLRGV